jgi:hypothetical protein
LDQWLGCLVGGAAGTLLVACLGIGMLMMVQRPQPVASSSPPESYDIEAIIEESYINRTMEGNTAGLPSPFPVVAASLDVRPGGQGDFVAKVKVGSLEPTIRGTAVLRATADGRLEVDLTDVRLGYLPITMFIPSAPIDQMNVAINEMMSERMGPMQARVAGVGGDETTLRFYLVADL